MDFNGGIIGSTKVQIRQLEIDMDIEWQKRTWTYADVK